MLYRLCRQIFALCVAYPIIYLWLGITLRHREHLCAKGPAIVIANHNSHLDILALISCFPLSLLPRVRIAAAADYFFTTGPSAFIAHWFLGLVPVHRTAGAVRDPLKGMSDCLEDGGILVLFPEGTRGRAEKLGEFKPGLWHLLKRCPHATLHPVYLHGLGCSMPKGAWLPMPFFIDACMGRPIPFAADKQHFMDRVRQIFYDLRAQTLAELRRERGEDSPQPEKGGSHE